MKQTLLFLLLWLGVLGHGHAQYQTPGTGVRWTLAQLAAASGGVVTGSGLTYQVASNLTLAAQDTLVITTNATVRLASLVQWQVAGVLLVNPPDSARITAVSATAPFHSLQFASTSAGSELHKTIVEYGGGIRSLGTSLVLDSCTVRYHVAAIGSVNTNSGAINVSGGRPRITHCRIYGNARSGILTPSNVATAPIIQHNLLADNNTTNGNWPQINLGAGGTAPTLIEYNRIVGRYNMAGGVAVSNLLGVPTVTQVVVRGNDIRNNRYGITMVGSNISCYITRNVIENNNINPNAATGGSGISLSGVASQTGVVSRNVIRGNLYGVTVLRSSTTAPSGPTVSFGNVTSTDTTDVGYNTLSGNGNGGQVYDFYNNTPTNLNAQNNNWGTTSAAEIESHIYHQPDDPALGLVNFQPFRLPLSSHRAPALTVSPYPNPARDQVTFALAAATPAHVQVYDLTGRLVIEATARPTAGIVTVPVSTLAPGLYTYRVAQAAATAAGKLLIAP